MSLQTWKDEFYPIPAAECLPEEALQHSIRKWEGLSQDNLDKHGVWHEEESAAIYDKIDSLRISGDSCVLCQYYAENQCIDCPLYHFRNHTPCDDIMSSIDDDYDMEDNSPYHCWVDDNDNMPMLNLLKAVANS